MSSGVVLRCWASYKAARKASAVINVTVHLDALQGRRYSFLAVTNRQPQNSLLMAGRRQIPHPTCSTVGSLLLAYTGIGFASLVPYRGVLPRALPRNAANHRSAVPASRCFYPV